jgi:hypothetical protein
MEMEWSNPWRFGERARLQQQANVYKIYIQNQTCTVLQKVLRIREPGWVKNQDTDHISESLNNIFWFKILKFFDADPGSGMEKIRIRDGKKSDPG